MKDVFSCFLIAVLLCSCTSKPNANIDALLELDSVVTRYSALHSFTSFKLYTKSINGVAICDSVKSKCKSDEIHYTVILDTIGISVSGFDSLVTEIDAVGFIKFYRYEDYSVWVENGAFGDVYGYLINHNPSKNVISFELNKRYHIGIGKKVRENVYYFSSNIK